jgi:acetylornithine deacetylase/succinyl-diaminopimelate desuccinylase-like protein
MPPGAEAVEVLQQLLRLNTVNPPGNERPAQEYLAALLTEAGLEVTLAGEEPERPNLIARLRGRADGPSLGLLSHVDTVVADPAEWRHDPWSGALDEGCVWGRGAIDMKSQTAAEVVAACSLARAGWRPERGDLIVISVIDEEEDGTGAIWLTEQRPELVRCDWLINEGAGVAFEVAGERVYDVCVGEKGVFRFTLTTDGAAGHASVPTLGDNALVKLAPLLTALGERRPGWDVTDSASGLFAALGAPIDGDPDRALADLTGRAPELAPLYEALLRVTFAPTMVDASQAMNVIPATANLHVDCRTPPGMAEPEVLERVREVLGDDGYRLTFTERTIGNESPVESPLMDAIARWVQRVEPGARTIPAVSPGYSDSRTIRAAFPDCVAYGFFPQRHMDVDEVYALVHAPDERIDVRDLALATDCYRALALDLLGGEDPTP